MHPYLLSLPIELRNNIYRSIVVSRLSKSLHLSLLRPICVDETIFRISYLKRDAVLPLLLTCRQIHSEASSILYAENVFVSTTSSLAMYLIKLFKLSPWYVKNFRNIFLRTKILCFPSPTPVEASLKLPTVSNTADRSMLGKTVYRSLSNSLYEIRLLNMLVRQAVQAKTGFLVDCERTIDLYPLQAGYGGRNGTLNSFTWMNRGQAHVSCRGCLLKAMIPQRGKCFAGSDGLTEMLRKTEWPTSISQLIYEIVRGIKLRVFAACYIDYPREQGRKRESG